MGALLQDVVIESPAHSTPRQSDRTKHQPLRHSNRTRPLPHLLTEGIANYTVKKAARSQLHHGHPQPLTVFASPGTERRAGPVGVCPSYTGRT